MKKNIKYILLILIVLLGFNMSVNAASGRGEYEKTCDYTANIGLNLKNSIIVKGSYCTMRVNVNGDMGAVETKNKDCPSDLAKWIKEHDACPPNFDYDPNADMDLNTNDDEVSYDGREEYQEEQKQNENNNDNPGTEVENNCKGLIGPNTMEFIEKALNTIMIVGPMLAVVLGSYDLIVAMANGEEDAKKKGIKKFKYRLFAAVLLLLLPEIIKFILSFFEQSSSCF